MLKIFMHAAFRIGKGNAMVMAALLRLPLTAKYEFDSGTESLDAYDAARALLGLSRSLAIATSFIVNEEIIAQAPALKRAKINLQPIREGSLEFIFDFLVPSNDAIRDGLYVALFWDYMKYLFSRGLGRRHTQLSAAAEQKIAEDGGSVDAVIDRLMPALRDAHRPISRGSGHAIIVAGNNNQISLFDRSSKEFLETEIIDDHLRTFEGSISSFNANSGVGGVFIPAEERVIRFTPSPTNVLDDQSRKAIGTSLQAYISRTPSDVRLRGHAVRTQSGELKRIIVLDVRAA